MQFCCKIIFSLFLFYFVVFSAPYEVFVSPSGNDFNLGTEAFPLKTLNCARDKAVANKTSEGLIITLLGGIYKLDSSFTLTSKHSGSNDAPFIIRGKEGDSAILSGGVELKSEDSKLCDESDIAAGIDPAYASKIRKWSFDDLGITDTGFWSMTNIKNGIIPQLYCNGSLMPLAQWPDTGYIKFDSVLVTEPVTSFFSTGDAVCKFVVYTDFLNKLQHEKTHVFMHGYWFWDWYDNYELLDSIDLVKNIIKAKSPYNSPYGYRSGQHFYVGNLFCKINKEGKWAVNSEKRVIYFWVPDIMKNRKTIITVNNNVIIYLKNASFIKLQNIVIQNTINNAVQISACTSCVISKCSLRNISCKGIVLDNTKKTTIENSNLFNIGQTAVHDLGDDSKGVVPSNNVISNNKIYNFAIIKKSYQPAVSLSINSVGCVITNNTISHAPHAAIIFMGNNHIIENNYIFDVCNHSQDAGAIYTGRDWAARGTIIRNNFIENCGTGDVNAIYIDDLACGIKVYNNIIRNIPQGIKLGGGRDNYFGNNIIINSTRWITADSRGLGWAKMWVDSGGTCRTRLASVPYTDSLWAQTYPSLLTILNDNPGCPKGNVVKGNTIVNSVKSSISVENIQYGIFDSNITLSSLSYYPRSKEYGVQVGLNVDTISPVSLLRMPVVPLVRNAFSKSGALHIVCVPSYHSDSVKARAVNLRTGDVYYGAGGDTVAFSGLAPGDYTYSLWYTGIPYQDSTFSAYDTVHFSQAGSLSPEAIYPQPDNPFILGGTGIDSATIALSWKVNEQGDDDGVDSIGLWYNEFGYPVTAYDSTSVKAGVWTVKTASDTITNLRADKLYYFSLFVANKDGTWSIAPVSARQQVRTGISGGKINGSEIILDGSEVKSLFSDSLKIRSDELVTSFIDTIDRWDVPATNGFIVSGPSLSFRNGNAPTNTKIHFSIKCHTPPSPYHGSDIRVYRFNINTDAWRLDTVKLTYDTGENAVRFSSGELGFPFVLMIDTIAPYISDYTIDTAAYTATVPLIDNFTVHDNIENPRISLLAGSGATGYSDISLYITPQGTNTSRENAGSGAYTSTIPAYVADPATGLRGILVVSDGRSDDTINLSRKIVRIGGNCDDEITPAMEWTALSVTAEPQNSALSDVFTRTPGVDEFEYDNREQRILQWLPTKSNSSSPDKWVEYNRDDADNFIFTLGKLFWIKTKNSLPVSYGTATVPALIDTFEIMLKKGEWSEFSLPYNFDIYAGDIIDATVQHEVTIDDIELYEWVKSEKAYCTRALYLPGIEDASNPANTFKAGGAFTAYNDGDKDVLLRIPPVCTELSKIGKNDNLAKKTNSSRQWFVKLGFRSDDGTGLSPVYCSALPENNLPRFYRAAPTLVSVSARIFDQKSGKRYGHAANGDLSAGGTSFIISCENQSDKTSIITATIDKITGLPPETSAALYWTNGKNSASPSTSRSVSIAAKQRSAGYLIVGSEDYIAGFIKNLNSVFSFSPFTVNNALRIRYSLPLDVKKATVSIFNLEGRRLDRIVLTTGLYAGERFLTVDRRFSSGYYIVQMKIETVDNTRPSVLNRRWMFVR